jgi:hypothetical protein
METRPPEMIARLVRVLVPPASREHVLGDLQERYVSPRQYLWDALRALPFIIASRLRRTTHPVGLLLAGAFFYWAVFWGNFQEHWRAALIPTLISLVVLALRDVYRDVTPKWFRAVAVDMAIAASAVLLSQAMLAATGSELLLTRATLQVGFPFGFVIVFFARWQTPTGFHQPPGFARSVSMQELRTEIVGYETTIRRAVRIEIGACIFVAAAFFCMLWAPAPLITKIGGGVTSLAALFIMWFLYTYARVRPIPETFGFVETVVGYQAELERRRRLSRSYGWWYVMPLSIGMGLMVIGQQLQHPDPLLRAAVSALILATVGAILVFVHRGLARKAQRRIEQLGQVSERVPVE